MDMFASSAKQRVLEAIEKLPPDATVEDAIERLIFLARIERGVAQLNAGRGMLHSQVKQGLLE
jgi:hypothetical protein